VCRSTAGHAFVLILLVRLSMTRSRLICFLLLDSFISPEIRQKTRSRVVVIDVLYLSNTDQNNESRPFYRSQPD
jgi:hypothetical protein